MAKYPKGETPADETPAPEPEMSLDEVRGVFMPFRKVIRELGKLDGAIESAMAARVRQQEAEREKARILGDIEGLTRQRADVDEGVRLARASLTGVQEQVKAAQAELEATKRQIADEKVTEAKRQESVKKAWADERAIAEREIADTRKRLDAVRAEMAELVKKHAA